MLSITHRKRKGGEREEGQKEGRIQDPGSEILILVLILCPEYRRPVDHYFASSCLYPVTLKTCHNDQGVNTAFCN